MLRSVLWQTRGAWRRDGVRTSWSLGTAAPGLDGARCAVGRTDPWPGPCHTAGGGLVAERNPRRTLTSSTCGVDPRALSPLVRLHCPDSAPHLAMHSSRASTELRVPHPHAAGAEGGMRRCGQRRCAPSPRPAARLCVRRLACWFQLLESSAFVVAGDYERGGLAAHTCPPLRGGAAQGLAAIYTTSGPWMASGAPSATTVPPTSVPRLGSAPPVDGRGGSGGAGAREVEPLQGACPRCTRALATGSQNSAGTRAAQRPRRLWRSSFPTPDAVPLVQTVAHCRLQPGGRALSAHETTGLFGCSCRFVRVCFSHETVIAPHRPATARVAPHAATLAPRARGAGRHTGGGARGAAACVIRQPNVQTLPSINVVFCVSPREQGTTRALSRRNRTGLPSHRLCEASRRRARLCGWWYP